jgi:hypothetical protein
MTQERLADLMVIAVEADRLKSVSLKDSSEHFWNNIGVDRR